MNLGAFWRYIKHSIRRYGGDNCPQLAAAISYYVLFSIVPLTFVLVSVFGLVIRSDRVRNEVTQRVVDSLGLEKGDVTLTADDERLRERLGGGPAQQVRDAMARLSPDDAQRLADALKARGRIEVSGYVLEKKDVSVRYDNSISDTLNNVAGASAPFTVLSLVVSAWSASAMFGAVRKALNIVWSVDVTRAYLQQKMLDLLMVLAFGVLMLASVVGTAGLRALREVSDETLGPLSTGTGLFWGVLPYVLPGLASFLVFASLYRLVPACSVRLRDVWFGAFVAAALFEVLKNGFAFYVANFRAYDLLYGSLGGILLFLTIVYFASSILLLGGELATSMPGLGAGAFNAVHDPTRPRVGLPEQARREVVNFFRSLVWAPRGRHGR